MVPIEEKTSSGWPIIVPDQKVQKINGNTSSGQNGVQVTKRVLYVVVTILAARLLVTIATFLLTREDEPTPVPPNYNGEVVSVFNYTKSDINVAVSGKLRIISRRDWLALVRSTSTDALPHPVPYVVIGHSETEECLAQKYCLQIMIDIQTFQMETRGMPDIAYNFLVGGDGYPYEGRGWDAAGEYALGYNNRSIGISFIGTFNSNLPPKKQIVAAKQLIELGVERGVIDSNYTLLGLRQITESVNTGKRLYEEIKLWPHWAEN